MFCLCRWVYSSWLLSLPIALRIWTWCFCVLHFALYSKISDEVSSRSNYIYPFIWFNLHVDWIYLSNANPTRTTIIIQFTASICKEEAVQAGTANKQARRVLQTARRFSRVITCTRERRSCHSNIVDAYILKSWERAKFSVTGLIAWYNFASFSRPLCRTLDFYAHRKYVISVAARH